MASTPSSVSSVGGVGNASTYKIGIYYKKAVFTFTKAIFNNFFSFSVAKTCNVYLESQSRMNLCPLLLVQNLGLSPKFFGLDENYFEANLVANSVAKSKVRYRTSFAKYSNSN